MSKEKKSPDMSGKKITKSSLIQIGFFIFPLLDQIDFTGPFEVLSRMPDVTIHIIGKTTEPVRDINGLILTPEITISEAPQLDLLVVPGGLGTQELMEDEEVLSLIRDQFNAGRYVFSVCTGALLCAAAGILINRPATTHWASWWLLKYYGAIPVKDRYVIDGNLITTSGVTAGIDGALMVTALIRGEAVAKEIQLDIEYAPDPPFNSGSPETASPETIQAFSHKFSAVRKIREETGLKYAHKFGIMVNENIDNSHHDYNFDTDDV